MQPLDPELTPRRPVWMWVGAAAGLGLALNMFLNNNGLRTGAAAAQPSTGTFLVSGTVVLGDSTSFTADGHGGCAGSGTHADVVDGALVLVTAKGGFGGGTLTAPRTLDDGTCWFSFSVPEVPAAQDSYLVMVASQDPREYTGQELTAGLATLRLD